MSTHNICIRREIRKILCGYPLLSVAMKMDITIVQIIFLIPLGSLSPFWLLLKSNTTEPVLGGIMQLLKLHCCI